jgi:hypothetical protein
MKTKSIVVGSAAVLIGVAVLAAVKARTQPTGPTTRIAVSVVSDEPTPPNTPITTTDFIPIVCLETRDKLVTVQSGPNGLVYLVETKDGKVLHENLSEEQLKAQAPETYELIKTAVSGNGTEDGSFLDARLGR